MTSHRLLVIEDDPKIAELVCRVADEGGFEVRTTSDFAEIPSLYDMFMPHVIVLDIIMPGMDGFEVLDFLYKRNSSTRIIVLSGQTEYRPMVTRMAEGLELAIVAAMAKPFRLAELRTILEKTKLSLPSLKKKSSSEAAA